MSIRNESKPKPTAAGGLESVEEKSVEDSAYDSVKTEAGPPREYEELVQKLEGDVRMHIRVEQQMRLHIENLQQQIEDLRKEIDKS